MNVYDYICVCVKIVSRLYAYKFAFICVYVIYYSFLFARISLLMCVCEDGYVFVYEHTIDSFMRFTGLSTLLQAPGQYYFTRLFSWYEGR